MSKKTSIHFEPCNVIKSEKHNSREQELDYIFPELTKNNESLCYVTDLKKRFDECKALHEKKTGRRMQEKTAPIREGVVVIDDKTTMDDLEILANEIRLELKWVPLQIHIHRDEGYLKSGDNKGGYKAAKLNLHAHIIFDCQDKQSGKMHRITKQQLSRVQTLTAQTLKLERGEKSTRKHLKSLEYKINLLEETEKEKKRKIQELEEIEKKKKEEITRKTQEYYKIEEISKHYIKNINEKKQEINLLDEAINTLYNKNNIEDIEDLKNKLIQQYNKVNNLSLGYKASEINEEEDIPKRRGLRR